MRTTRSCLSLLALTLSFTPLALAQFSDPVMTAQAPRPGSYHDYIGIGAEVVNPADGSLSFDLPIRLPPGRELSMPFGIRYTGSDQFQLNHFATSLQWVKSQFSPFEVGGWSYLLPAYTSSSTQKANGYCYPPNCPFNPTTAYCDYTSNYMFRGFDSGFYNLGVGSQWPDATYPSPNCQATATGSHFGRGWLASTPCSGLTVTDPSGSTYQFSGPVCSGSVSGIFGALAYSITDRNGNQISLQNTRNSVFSCCTPMSGNAYIDTLGRQAVSWTGLGNNNDNITIAGLGGNVVLKWGTATAHFPESAQVVWDSGLGCTYTGGQATTIPALTEIDLPNGQKYSFTYDATYGLISKISFPGGGYVRYVWNLYSSSSASGYLSYTYPSGPNAGQTDYCFAIFDTPAISDRYVSYDGQTEVLHQTFRYSTSWNTFPGYPVPDSWSAKSTTVTSTDLLTGQSTVTNYAYAGVLPALGPYDYSSWNPKIPVEQTIVYKDGSNNTQKTVNKNSGQYTVSAEQTVLDNGQGITTLSCYNSNMQVTDVYEYGFQSEGAYPGDPSCVSSSGLNTTARGPLRRHTQTAYHNFPGGTPSTNIVNEPDSVTVYDGSGSQVKRTTFTYDANAVVASGAQTGLVSPPGLRGNASTVTRWLNTGGSSPITSYTYFDTGQVLSFTDPCGNATCSDMTGSNHTTTYSYSDNFASGTGTPPGQTNAYLKQVTYPNTGVAHTETFSWGYNDGLRRSHADQNSQTTTYTYNTPPTGCSFPDGLNRLSTVTYPDGGNTKYCYNDTPYNSSTPSPSLTTTKTITSTTNLTTLAAFDGLGHVVQTRLTSDSDGTTYTATAYDALGRVNQVYNPTRCNPPTTNCGESTWGYSATFYDALGRVTQVTNPDHSTVLKNYSGRATRIQDEGSNLPGTQRVTRISQTDALGRLVSVCEVSSSTLLGNGGTPGACGQDIAATGFLTSYQYDALDNLTSVSMSGLNPRTFAYDSLARLTSATNPESGRICYGTVSGGACQPNGYDANGNLVTKTDARGIATTFRYDALNRLTGKTYSDGTPAATFNYDQSSALGVTLTNTKGRKSSQSTAGPNATGSVFSYDTMGRISNNSQCTPQNCGTGVFAFQYTQYDFVGDLISATNATGVTFNYAYNTAARLTGITTNFIDGSHPGTLFSNAHYSPFGFLTGGTLGNGVTESWSYNKRGWQLSRTARFGAATPYSFNGITFAPDGDILAANDSANGNWVYAYDAFNRLTCSNLASNGTCAAPTSGTPTYTYDYDRFGNRWHQNGSRSSQLGFDANNHITGVTGVGYDLAGNLTSDGSGTGSHRYFYDAENRIIQVDGTLGTCSTATACYVYNAEGQRVRKTTGGSSMDYLYDLAGHKVADVDPTGIFMQGELYAGDRHFAIYAPEPGPTGATFFTHSDWLGTERVRTDMTGTNCESIASLPFGDGQSITGTCGDVSPMHFTGKERDSESGLDNFGARYDSSSMGRFMSPDPLYIEAHRLADPQRLNLFAYARNNPVNLTDPTGLDVELKCDTQANCNKAVQDFNGRKGAQFKVELGKDGKLHVVKGSVAKNLSTAEGALMGAINNTTNHATINVSGNTGQSEFGVHDSRGVNSVDLGNLSELDAPSNAGGLNSGDVLAHEAMDAYFSLFVKASTADILAAELFPGLLMPHFNTQIDRTSGVLFGQTSDHTISHGHDALGIERITIQYITPIPFSSLNARQIQGAERAAGSRTTEVTFVPPKP